MSRLGEILKEKFPGLIERAWQESERSHCVLTAKENAHRFIHFLTGELEMRFVLVWALDHRKEKESLSFPRKRESMDPRLKHAGMTKGDHFQLRYLCSHRHHDEFLTVVVSVSETAPAFPSITPLIPYADWQEREIQDMFGLKPIGHPSPRRLVLHETWPEGVFPLRKDFSWNEKVPKVSGTYEFETVAGEGVFEIPVGPVHAGIIEPGHFRFSSGGESILKLEIRHFYKHKGLEKLGEGKLPVHLLTLAERISGDHSVAHAVACAQALETLSGLEIPRRAQLIRIVYLELERLYNHLADISGVILDVAFGFGSAQLSRIREYLMRLNERVSGSRLLRSVVAFGGVRKNLADSEMKWIIGETKKIKKDIDETFKILWNVSSVLDRIQGTGVIKKEIAEALGGTGPIARASGIDRDLRRDHSYGLYDQLLFMVPVAGEGDVEARIRVRIQELYESLKLIHEAIDSMPEGDCWIEPKPLPRSKSALGYVESSRGELFHWIETDSSGAISRWKIHSPSFQNWPLIQYAVMDNIVPDFPVINKSMNLSYSGNDR